MAFANFAEGEVVLVKARSRPFDRRINSVRERCCLQIIDRAPGARSDQRYRRFPWLLARRVIDRFFAPPKDVTNTQSARNLAPIVGALHQLGEQIVGVCVIETLRPKVTRITKRDLPTLEQNRVIVSWVSGESSLHWQTPDRIANRVEFRAISKSPTSSVGGQST